MKNKLFRISLIYFIAILSIAILFVLGSFGFIQNEYISSFLIQIVVMLAVPMLLYTLLVSKNFKKTIKDTGLTKFSVKMLIISLLLGLVLFFINSFVANFFSSLISIFGYEKITTTESVKVNYAFLLKEFTLSAILPGICEEFLHRGIMLKAQKEQANPRYCLIISSILFGLMHLNIAQFFYATILGFLMGIVCLASDSLYPTIIIHFMNNFLSSYLYYGAKKEFPLAVLVNEIENFLMSNFMLYVSASVIGMVLAIYAYKHLVKMLVFERTKIEMTKVLDDLNILNKPMEEAQVQLRQINTVLSSSKSVKGIVGTDNTKVEFKNKIFIISSFVLGILVTICSFIWGIL